MRIHFTTTCLTVILCTLSQTSARGVTIIDLTTHTILFKDTFENPTPEVGSATFGPDVTITNAPSPGPAQGSFYLQLFRNSNTPGQGNYSPTFSAASATDIILLTMMVYLPAASDADARAQLILDNGDFNTARAWARPNGSGHVEVVGPAFAITTTAVPYATDAWQEWDLQYNGNGTFNVSVNGVTASGFASPTTGAVGHADLFNGVVTPGSFFLDAVPTAVGGSAPEPATLSLAAGAIVVLAIARRTRTGR